MKKIFALILLLAMILPISSCTFLLTETPGATGEKGEKGDDGQDGVGIAKTEINDKGELIITMTDGTVNNLGVVVGKDGVDGVQGEQGPAGENGEILSDDIYAASYGVIPGAVDMSKFESLLKDAVGKTVRFNSGTYIFPSHINMPSNISFIGSTKTVFTLASDSTSNVLFYMVGVTNVTLSKLFIDGGLTSQPAGSHTIDDTLFDKIGAGNRYGIYMNKCRRINLHDLDILGWDMAGIYCKNNDAGSGEEGRFFHSVQITNSSLYYNYYGLWFDEYGEYNQVSGCTFGDNYIGALNCGGNNQYSGCMFNSNWCGFALLGTNITNESHGGCYSSTYNHNSITGLGGGIAIYAKNSTIGWNFTGQNIWYGAVVLQDCKGVIFNGTIVGNVQFKSTNSQGLQNQNVFTHTYFYTDPSTFFSENDGSTYIEDYISKVN